MEAVKNQPKRISNRSLRAVPGGKKRARRGLSAQFLMLASVFVLGLVIMLYVIQLALIAQNGLEVERLKVQREEAESTAQSLRMEVQALSSPKRMEAIGARLGMVEPAEVHQLPVAALELVENADEPLRLSDISGKSNSADSANPPGGTD